MLSGLLLGDLGNPGRHLLGRAARSCVASFSLVVFWLDFSVNLCYLSLALCEDRDAFDGDCLVRDELARICHIDVNLGKLAAWSKSFQPAPE